MAVLEIKQNVMLNLILALDALGLYSLLSCGSSHNKEKSFLGLEIQFPPQRGAA